MAARLNPQQDERSRTAIQTTQLVKRLQSFVNGEVELNAAQVTAAMGLLKKTLPDLQSVELTGANGGAVQFETTVDPRQLTNDQLRALASIPLGGRDSSEEGASISPPDRLH